MTCFAIQRIKATSVALKLIVGLSEKHGPVSFFPSGSCFDGSAPTCLEGAELVPSSSDAKVGEITRISDSSEVTAR